MSLLTLAKRRLLDPVRTRSLWVMLALFALVFGLMGYLGGSNSMLDTATQSVAIMAFLLPLVALSYSYDAIAGPRESGSLRVLLSYPFTRREVVLGTLVGRIAVVTLGVLAGVLAAIVATVAFGGSLDLVAFGIVLAVSTLFAAVMVAIGVGISASVPTTNAAVLTAFGSYLLYFAFWDLLPTLGRYVLNGFAFPTGPPPEWVLIWSQLNPITAYRAVAEAVLAQPPTGAFYHTVWFAIVVLGAWFVLTIGIGLVRFDRADL